MTLFREIIIHEIYISEIERGLLLQFRTIFDRGWEKFWIFSNQGFQIVTVQWNFDTFIRFLILNSSLTIECVFVICESIYRLIH